MFKLLIVKLKERQCMLWSTKGESIIAKALTDLNTTFYMEIIHTGKIPNFVIR